MSDLIGQMLGQYTITEQLGMGGMAAVYRARQESIGREVAVKLMLPHVLALDETFLDRFHREVKIAASLQHPHILPIYDFGDYEGQPYIVMACFEGGTLAERIKREGALKLTETARLVRQLADALDYAHSQGVIHRDFKPDNTIFDDRGNIYLTDFGLAKMVGASNLTGTGAILGTPDYMAPDWGNNSDVTHSVDIYALGVTIYEMLTGHVQFRADTPMAVLMLHISQTVPDHPNQVTKVPTCHRDKRQRGRDRAAVSGPGRRGWSGSLAVAAVRCVWRGARTGETAVRVTPQRHCNRYAPSCCYR